MYRGFEWVYNLGEPTSDMFFDSFFLWLFVIEDDLYFYMLSIDFDFFFKSIVGAEMSYYFFLFITETDTILQICRIVKVLTTG